MKAFVAAAALLAGWICLTGCPAEEWERPIPGGGVSPAVSDGGVDADAAAESEDVPSQPWPSTVVKKIANNSTSPALSITASNKVLLVYANNGRRSVLVDPATSTLGALDIGPGGGTNIRAASKGDESVFVWEGTHVARFNSGALVGNSFPITTSTIGSATIELGLTWTGAKPLVVLDVNENNRFVHYALSVETGSAGTVPNQASLGSYQRVARAWQEAPTIWDIGGDRAVVFQEIGEVPTSGSTAAIAAAWFLVKRDPSGPTTGPGVYMILEDSGTLVLPGPTDVSRRWIQVHDMGSGKGILTWVHIPPGLAAGMQFYDVYMTKVKWNATTGEPELEGDFVNVSKTTGYMDNSDHPIVLSDYHNRYWVAWRENSFGPRVAVFDSNLNKLFNYKPSTELKLDTKDTLAAAVAPNGDLHLAAVVQPSGTDKEIWYWVLPVLP